jgi:hypothetical protein
MNEQTLSEIEARYPDPDPIDNDVRALVAEVRKLRADLDYHENTCNPEVDNLRKLLAVANLQVGVIRKLVDNSQWHAGGYRLVSDEAFEAIFIEKQLEPSGLKCGRCGLPTESEAHREECRS